MDFNDSNDSNDSNDMVEVAEINMTPLVDVMLVLLIIFMVTMPFVYHSVEVNVPELVNSTVERQQSVEVKISKSGQLFLYNKAISRQQLIQNLANSAVTTLKPEVNISADQQVSYQQLIELMLLIQSTGLDSIQFVTPQ